VWKWRPVPRVYPPSGQLLDQNAHSKSDIYISWSHVLWRKNASHNLKKLSSWCRTVTLRIQKDVPKKLSQRFDQTRVLYSELEHRHSASMIGKKTTDCKCFVARISRIM
jgi:hypothetical protein